MQLFADDSKEPKIIGETVIDLTPVLKLGEHDGEMNVPAVRFSFALTDIFVTDWYALSHKDRYAGEVSLEFIP